MYTIHKKSSPNKIRDINIAIAYHNTDQTLKDVALQHGISSRSVERIHCSLVRHMARCNSLNDVWFYTYHKNHSEEMATYLQEYKYLLENNLLKTEIILNDEDNRAVVVLSSDKNEEFVIIHVKDGVENAQVSIDDLKLALRKLSVK